MSKSLEKDGENKGVADKAKREEGQVEANTNPHLFADMVYEAVCKDTDEKPSTRGRQAFREKVFENCTASEIVLQDCKLGPRACTTLVKLIKGSDIRRLDVSNNALEDFGVLSALQVIQSVRSLRFVDLSSNTIGSKGALEIGRVLALNSTLLSLELGSPPGSLSKNNIQNKASCKIAEALCKNKTLTCLGLRGNPTGRGGPKAAEMFAVMLSRNKTLTHLSLQDNSLGTKGASVICAALARNRSLRHLNLAGNELGPDLAQTLEVVLGMNSTLCSLRLQHNTIGQGVMHFARALMHNQSLVVLDLESNGLGDAGCEALCGVLVHNRSLTSLNLANNRITEHGGQAVAYALSQNPVLTALNLSMNPLKNESAVAMAESIASNNALLSLELCTCKIGDKGAVAIASAIGNSKEVLLKRIRMRDNYISGPAGVLIFDALKRNTTLTIADFRGNQLDYVGLNRIRNMCKRNLAEIKDAEPRRLRREIARLKGEQIKLRKAENTLKEYQSGIAATKAQIDSIEADKAAFLTEQTDRRTEIKALIAKESKSIDEARVKLQEKKDQLLQTEAKYNEQLQGLQMNLDAELSERKRVEALLARAKKELEETIQDRPAKVNALKRQIVTLKEEKMRYHGQLAQIRKELARLQKAYQDGNPIPELVDQARTLLIENAALLEAAKKKEDKARKAEEREMEELEQAKVQQKLSDEYEAEQSREDHTSDSP